MNIGISLPLVGEDLRPEITAEWSRRAESYGFESVGILDRIIYNNYDPLVSLAFAAGATTTIHLFTHILMTPLHPTVLLAKQLASLDNLSGQRLRVGVGLGGRPDDYEACGVEWDRRGQIFDGQLREMREIWKGEGPWGVKLGPKPLRPGGPEILIGGLVQSVERTITYGDGWTSGWVARVEDDVAYVHSGNPKGPNAGADSLSDRAATLRKAWSDAGRAGQPIIATSSYFTLDPGGADAARAYLAHFYGHDDLLKQDVVDGVATSPEKILQYTRAVEKAGCDSITFGPCTKDFGEMDGLASILTEAGYLKPRD